MKLMVELGLDDQHPGTQGTVPNVGFGREIDEDQSGVWSAFWGIGHCRYAVCVTFACLIDVVPISKIWYCSQKMGQGLLVLLPDVIVRGPTTE